MRKRVILGIAIGLVTVAISIMGLGRAPDQAAAPASSGPAPDQPGAALPRRALPAMPAPAAAAPAGPAVDQALVAHLQEKYGASIDSAYVQMQLLELLMRHFQKHSPERWQEAVLEAVRAAFPELSGEIAALFRGRLDYEAWMDGNRDRLRGLDPAARREAMWQERERLFGRERAAEIWASEIENQAVADALAVIDGQDGASVADRLSMYRESLEDIHGDGADAYLERHRHQALSRFLDLASVQAELSVMAPEQRRQTLREIRAGMGLGEDALARWDRLDQVRDQRWDHGERYMEERAALAELYQGEELERRVHELRVRYFGDEADTIRREEQSGFFRYQRERRWGRN